MRKLLTLYDLEKTELQHVIERSVEVFSELKQGKFKPKKSLNGEIGLIYFEKPSTRTRLSFEVAITKLGGKPIFISPAETQISRGEDKSDFIKVISGYVDFIVARVYDHGTLELFERNTDLPVINALSDLSHPTQIISDLATIKYLLGGYEGKRVCFFGDAKNNVARSWIEAHNVLGNFELSFSCPEGLEPDERGNYKIESDPEKAISYADVVYLDVWFSMGQEYDEQKFKKLQPYSIDDTRADLLSGKIVLHCLPAKKGEEISHGVFSKHEREIFLQAHMKLAGAISIIEKLCSA